MPWLHVQESQEVIGGGVIRLALSSRDYFYLYLGKFFCVKERQSLFFYLPPDA